MSDITTAIMITILGIGLCFFFLLWSKREKQSKKDRFIAKEHFHNKETESLEGFSEDLKTVGWDDDEDDEDDYKGMREINIGHLIKILIGLTITIFIGVTILGELKSVVPNPPVESDITTNLVDSGVANTLIKLATFFFAITLIGAIIFLGVSALRAGGL